MDPERSVGEHSCAMAAGSSVDDALERVVKLCVKAVDHCDMAGISVAKKGRVRTLVASSDLLRFLDDLQFQLREGPCFEVLSSSEPVTADDLATDPRWPSWGPLIAERTGVHASMSYRLSTHGEVLGALNMYSTAPAGFDDEDYGQGPVLATRAAVAVANNLQPLFTPAPRQASPPR